MNMRSIRRIWMAVLMAALAGIVMPLHGVTEQFAEDCRFLTRAPHRLSGTAECDTAADYIRNRLGRIGVDEVVVQEFRTTQTAVRRCDITVTPSAAEDSVRRLALQPMRPDGIMPPVTDSGGVSGPIRHVGAGCAEDLGSVDLRDAIVVMDYNNRNRWLRAFRLGAQAVIFVRNGPCRSDEFHYVHTEANFLRFFYDGPPEDLREGAEGRIRSHVTWVPAMGRNVIGMIRGRNPRFELGSPEMIVVGANLDSYGEVPRLSPGARGAINCAGLLRIASHFVANPPDRHMMFVFYDGQARCHLGSSHFYRIMDTLTARFSHARLEKAEEYLQSEREYLEGLLVALKQDNPHNVEDGAIRRKLLRKLKTRVEDRDKAILQQKREVGNQRLGLDKSDPLYQTLTARMDSIEAVRLDWNRLRRQLDEGVFTDEIRPKLERVIEGIRVQTERRLAGQTRELGVLESDRRLKELKDDSWVSLSVSLLLGDRSPRWAVTAGGNSTLYQGNSSELQSGNPNLADKLYRVIHEEYRRTGRSAVPNFEPTSVGGVISPRHFGGRTLVHPAEVAERLGIYNIAFTTVQEPWDVEGTPDDTLGRWNLEVMERQCAEAARFLHALSTTPSLSLIRVVRPDRMYWSLRWKDNDTPEGPHVIANAFGSPYKNRYIADATVRLMLSQKQELFFYFNPLKIPGFDDFQVHRTSANGFFGFGPAPYGKDEQDENQEAVAIKFDDTGCPEIYSGTSKKVYKRLEAAPFGSRGALVLPPSLFPQGVGLFEGDGNSQLASTEDNQVFTEEGVVHWMLQSKVDVVKAFGSHGTLPTVVVLNNGGERLPNRGDRIPSPYGVGFGVEEGWWPPRSVHRSATDLWRLNEHRLRVLRSGGILKRSLEELHSMARQSIVGADSTGSIARSESRAAAGFMQELPVYTRVKGTLNDLVVSVLFLLVCTLPFAFALERLLINAKTVYGRVGGFILFFVLTFLVLYFTHPAFSLSAMPLVIFLGFFILVMSGLVISLLVQKFESELKVVQGLAGTVHTADVSRFGTMVAAMSMGISSMRRRPLRTTLTAVTILLLTFTILCFASFELAPGVTSSFAGSFPGYSGALFSKFFHDRIDDAVVDMVREDLDDQAEVHARYWKPQTLSKNYKGPGFGETLVSNRRLNSHAIVEGVLGIEWDELAHRRDMRRVFGVDDWERLDSTALFLSGPVARRVGLEPGDTVLAGGRTFILAGIIESAGMARLVDIDGNSVFPYQSKVTPKFDLSKAEEEAVDAGISAEGEELTPPLGSMAVMDAEAARAIGATARVVAAYTNDPHASAAVGRRLAGILPVSVYATAADGVYRYRLGQKATVEGLKDLFLPILLGGLVILGTMLGSVTDREKEIYTFSALGLAPAHVASLFFIESLIYAFVGGLGGYLVAQGFAVVIDVFARYGWVTAPEINYSSTNSIFTMLVVMATVLLSAVYPAYKASKSANPGVIRTWKMPKPEGDRLVIMFPFTVSSYDITGVVSFLKEHFDRFSDTSLGVFMAENTEFFSAGEDALGIRSVLALTPFDLGVTEDFELRSVPSSIEGIDEIRITIDRRSGLAADWERLNKNLLNDLRKQMLIWRSLPKETMEMYRSRTLELLGEKQGA